MTTAAEIFAGDFFRSFEAKQNQNFCVVCSRHFNGTAYYRHIKSKMHSSTLNKKSLKDFSPLINE